MLEDPTLAASGVAANNEAQVDALRSVLGLGGGALAVGAAARGLAGIGSFLGRNLGGGPPTTPRQSFVRIPVPVKVRSREERDAMLAEAEQELGQEGGFAKLAGVVERMADTLGLLRRPGDQANMVQDAVGGWGNTHASGMPWAYPAGGAALFGGLYGGWKLTDYLLDKTKNVEQESELEQARKDYESVLAGRRKLAAAGAVDDGPLDVLADLYEKRAWIEQAKGVGLLGMGLAAGLSGLGAYNWTRSVAEDQAVEEAVKRRQAQIAEQSPNPTIAIPMPVPVYSPRQSHWHGLLGHRPHKDNDREKAANIGQAADQFLGRIKANQMAVWQRMMTPTDGKPAKPEKPAEPAPPQLPTLAGTRPVATAPR